MKEILKEKRRGKVSKGVLFMHDNAPAHQTLATQTKLTYLGYSVSLSSTLLSGSNPIWRHLFPGLKKQLRFRHFSSDAEISAAADTWLDRQIS